ncbi:hypothetical protein FB45DRAFT_1023525 [Roridomyces roridus]|uniref:DUF302 domain-containing protein n=1 Tax=Roridomyces roridus TaxID=1738132 RepID=A0AAD7FUL4_9AGAR|nr:hypothetical protein FB45DRAFT_1023525 [Roridomyces roridus]
MSQKTITAHTLQLVTFRTTLPTSEVISRLDKELGKHTTPGVSGLQQSTSSKENFEAYLNSAAGPSGFLYFNEFNHGAWMQLFSSPSKGVVYVIGNPLIAETMLRHDMQAGLNIPPRLMILEKKDGQGTEVVYHLPSSVIALGDDQSLRDAAEALDRKIEQLVERIAAAV